MSEEGTSRQQSPSRLVANHTTLTSDSIKKESRLDQVLHLITLPSYEAPRWPFFICSECLWNIEFCTRSKDARTRQLPWHTRTEHLRVRVNTRVGPRSSTLRLACCGRVVEHVPAHSNWQVETLEFDRFLALSFINPLAAIWAVFK